MLYRFNHKNYCEAIDLLTIKAASFEGFLHVGRGCGLNANGGFFWIERNLKGPGMEMQLVFSRCFARRAINIITDDGVAKGSAVNA